MRWPLVTRSMLEESHRLALRGVVIERDELRASLDTTKADIEAAHREIAHLQVDLAEARRTASSAEEANRQLRDTIQAHQSLGSIVAQFKPMLRRIAQPKPKPVKAPPRGRAKQKGGAS